MLTEACHRMLESAELLTQIVVLLMEGSIIRKTCSLN